MAFGESKKLWIGSVALLLAGPFAGWQLASWPVKLRYPGEENLAEGIPLAEMLHLRQGVRIYDPPSPERFDAANYGPLYYLLGSRLVNPQEPAYLPLRLVSLLGTLGCAAGCSLLALWLSRSYFAATLAPLLFLSYRIVTFHGISARCDVVALSLSFWGFLIAYRSRNSRTLLLAVPLILLGFFYKQQFVAEPLAILLFLLLERRYRLAAEFAASAVLGGLGLLAFFQFVAFPQEAFLKHFLSYNVLPFSAQRFGSGIVFFGTLFFFPALVGSEFLRCRRDKLLACYVGCAITLGIVTFAREGSDANYFLACALVLSSLFAALLAERLTERSRPAELLVLLVISVLLGQLFATSPPRQEDFARDRTLQDFLGRNFSPSTLALGYYTGDLVRARLDTPISNLYHFTWLIRKGLTSDRDLCSELHNHRFGVVVLNFDLEHDQNPYWVNYYLTEPMRQAILANYQPEASLEMPEVEKFRANDRFYVWVPRGLR